MFQAVHVYLFPEDVKKTLLVQDSTPIVSLLAVYIVFVKWVGPVMMRNRKPFNLTRTILVYNFCQVFINFYLTYNLGSLIYNLWHMRCLVTKNPVYPAYMELITPFHYLVYLDRILDCLDTIFFVLRKKYTHITFLHVFHHVAMCIFIYYSFKSIEPVFFHLVGITINTGVHTIMYFYYALAACGPQIQKYLWWKKYLTRVQIMQFMAIMAYIASDYVTGCEEFGAFDVAIFIFLVMLVGLFYNFYTKAFKKE